MTEIKPDGMAVMVLCGASNSQLQVGFSLFFLLTLHWDQSDPISREFSWALVETAEFALTLSPHLVNELTD